MENFPIGWEFVNIEFEPKEQKILQLSKEEYEDILYLKETGFFNFKSGSYTAHRDQNGIFRNYDLLLKGIKQKGGIDKRFGYVK